MSDTRDCDHGQLARSCYICELEELLDWHAEQIKAGKVIEWYDPAQPLYYIEFTASGVIVNGETWRGMIDRAMDLESGQ